METASKLANGLNDSPLVCLDAVSSISQDRDSQIAEIWNNQKPVSDSPLTSEPQKCEGVNAKPEQGKRRGKSLSRRSGQYGYIGINKGWYVARYRLDVPGQQKRVYKSKRICTVDGPDCLTVTERRRKLREMR